MFGESGGDAAPAFEMQEGVLNQMPQFIQLLVVRSLCGSIVTCDGSRPAARAQHAVT